MLLCSSMNALYLCISAKKTNQKESDKKDKSRSTKETTGDQCNVNARFKYSATLVFSVHFYILALYVVHSWSF